MDEQAWMKAEPILRLMLTNYKNETEWELHCPATQQEIDRALRALVVSSPEECQIGVDSYKISFIHSGRWVMPAELDLLPTLNQFARLVEDHCGDQIDKYNAAVEVEGAFDIRELMKIAENIDQFTFASDKKELGKIILQKYLPETEWHLLDAFDTEKFAEDYLETHYGEVLPTGIIIPPAQQEPNQSVQEEPAPDSPEQTQSM